MFAEGGGGSVSLHQGVSLQKMLIRALILNSSFHDQQRCETVCRMSRVDILALLTGPVEVDDVPDVEKGEVLVDSRGQGSFQR
jgi:hypothetical protein